MLCPMLTEARADASDDVRCQRKPAAVQRVEGEDDEGQSLRIVDGV